MFYFIASKILKKINSTETCMETKLRNIIIVGSICYIILHAFLYKKNTSVKLEKYRHYIYYMFLIDGILSCSYVYLFDKPIPDGTLIKSVITDTNLISSAELVPETGSIKKLMNPLSEAPVTPFVAKALNTHQKDTTDAFSAEKSPKSENDTDTIIPAYPY
jgi:hypothetical protein